MFSLFSYSDMISTFSEPPFTTWTLTFSVGDLSFMKD